MINILREDLSAATASGGMSIKLKIIFFSHAFHLVFLYRIGSLLSIIPMFGSILRVVFEYAIRIIFSSDISLKSKIGSGLVIVHGHDIVIGGDVIIGKNCKILNGVTLGNKDTESNVNQQPRVGDNVVIGTGAKLLGRIVVGDNATIGANSVVLSDVPPGSTFAGVPAKAVRKL